MSAVLGSCIAAATGVMGPAPHVSAAAVPPAETGAVETQASKPADGEPGALTIFQAPLLREGSHIVQAVSAVKRDPRTGWWTATLTAAHDVDVVDAAGPPRELILLPCTRLAEIQRIIESAPGQRLIFELSGHVYAYRGRNYLVPTSAPVLMDERAAADLPGESGAVDESAGRSGTMPSEEGALSSDAAPPPDSAEQIARDVRRETRARRPEDRRQVTNANGGQGLEGDADSAGMLEDRSAADGSTMPAHAQDAAGAWRPARAAAPLREGTLIVDRRGKIMRDRNGGWSFIFDADSSGLADPPLRLLPCLLLEAIEDYARRAGNNSPLLLCGQVYLYHGHNHLMPTGFRIPRDRANITP